MTCTACGHSNRPDARFCDNCGSPLRPGSAGSEERKLVTVLFADAVASTTLAGALDPERLRTQMARFFEIAREEIERFGGTVEKFIGDAVMAVFGLPAIHEDDPERAARAAVAIRARLQPQIAEGSALPVRIGLTTGEVVADPRAAEKGEFLVTGEAVHLAARLQQHAEAGQILIDERTMHGVRRMARTQPLPPLSVRGKDEPVAAWDVRDVDPPRERELRPTPFVGREEELALLHGLLRRVERDRRGHVVTVLGAAGVGKTRLAREFQIRASGVHVLRGRALPYGTGVPFWSIGEAIREECGITFGDPLDLARAKVADTAHRLEIGDAIPALQVVLGLASERPEVPREALFAGMRAFFQALAHRATVIFLLEDMHSAEDVTLDFLEHAGEWTRDVPLLLIVLSRPTLVERRPDWMGGRRSATTLFLDPFGGEESRALAAGLLADRAAPEPLLRLVLDRADGNPLFIEEMLRSLMERGVLVPDDQRWTLTIPMSAVTIPDSVHTVIAARIDALPAGEKRVLQAASVQGKDFWLGAVGHVAGEDSTLEVMEGLIVKEMVTRKPRSTLAGEEEFTFRHILIRDVTYATIPKTQRWPNHARLAEWMQLTAGDRPAEMADMIAYHWLQVAALRRELGLPPDAGVQAEAVRYLLLAGERAAAVYANTTALDHYGHILDLDPPPAHRLRALQARGEVWNLIGQYERAREDLEAARAFARQSGERRAEIMALDQIGFTHRQQDQVPAALRHLEEALALSREVDDPVLVGRTLNHIGFTLFGDGRHAEAIRHHEEARLLLENAEAFGLAESLHGLGENRMFQGRFREAIEALDRSATLSDQLANRSLAAENRYMAAFARWRLGEAIQPETDAERVVEVLTEIGDVRNLAAAIYVAAQIAATKGRFAQALEWAGRGVELAREIGSPRLTVYNLLVIGQVHRELEDARGAWRADRDAGDLAAGLGGGAWLPGVMASLALDAAGLGRLEEASVYVAQAHQALVATETRRDFPQEIAFAEARVALARGRAAEALESTTRLRGIAGKTGTTAYWEPATALLAADAMAGLGDLEAAIAEYRTAFEGAEAAGSLPLLWRALAGLAGAQRAAGRSEEAAQAARRATEIIGQLAGSVRDERLRATFLQSSSVQRIIEREH